MNHKAETLQDCLFVGIDSATKEHVLCLVGPEGERIESLPHEPEAIAEWIAGVKNRFPASVSRGITRGHRLGQLDPPCLIRP